MYEARIEFDIKAIMLLLATIWKVYWYWNFSSLILDWIQSFLGNIFGCMHVKELRHAKCKKEVSS